jgi:hypothetical protein
MIVDFKEYAPETAGITSLNEVRKITDHFEIEGKSALDLQNLRDMVVLVYGDWMRAERKLNNWEEFDRLSEAMQSITAVIDYYKYNA